MPSLTVDRNGAGLRLDRYLKKVLPGMPSSHIFKLLRTRKVRVNGNRARGDFRLSENDQVLVHMPAERFEQDASRPVRRALGMDFTTVYEDDHLLVVSKPPFLPVHPGAGHASNSLIDQVHAYLEVQDRPGAFRPSLAHRLDRDTSGLLMIGKDAQTLRYLSDMLKRGEIGKKYLALALGRPRPATGTWELAVKKRGRNRNGSIDVMGKTAFRTATTRSLRLTKNRKLDVSLLVLELLTGRTHQIRSHLEQVGLTLLGDRRYGDRELNRSLRERFGLRRQFLHAYRLALTHPITKNPLSLATPYPDDLLPLVDHLRLGVPAY